MTALSNIQRNVMRRVRFIRATRPFVSGAAGAVYLLLISLYLLGREVFVAQVFRNAPHRPDPTAVLRFAEVAFLNTSFIVQVLSVLALMALIWLGRECVRALAPARQHFA